MAKPRPLHPGDTIGVVSPSSPIDPEKLERGLRVVEEAGFQVKRFPHVLDADHYLAGSDRDRAEDLQGAFLDPEVDAIWCSRGGYGCARLLPHLDLDAMAAANKLFLGFSDITTIHLALNRRGLPTIHAPMALSLSVPREPYVLESFLSVLRGDDPIPAAAPRGATLVGGVAEGTVTGGCLCLLCDSLATADSLDAAGKIVLIEDVDENPHRVDAMLTHLLNAQVLPAAAGIVIGEMSNTDDRHDASIGGRPWREIVTERLAPLGIPTVLDFPFGHRKEMLSLPLGIRARLDADAGTLTYLESPTSSGETDCA